MTIPHETASCVMLLWLAANLESLMPLTALGIMKNGAALTRTKLAPEQPRYLGRGLRLFPRIFRGFVFRRQPSLTACRFLSRSLRHTRRHPNASYGGRFCPQTSSYRHARPYSNSCPSKTCSKTLFQRLSVTLLHNPFTRNTFMGDAVGDTG